ncbi:hypothetical protein ES319_A09G056700v1 [Gossypium barbadense]|uniref:Uncharacterized protein n=2 Tax=Gossypium TaxID=3633 RepID=A0A2P5WSC2_GOSBA|nr:hypothetical protein ES319_A09G056700v1 [Gossypium barbadense]PPR93973.1 hypothetical protein GOBAR_AA26699 [Gossypium barbadense]TYH01594.1 hypothetical protein ES288_A09G071600v1 [Gossypium darwinii]
MALPVELAKVKEDPVAISVNEMLKSSSLASPKPCISKVPNYLRQVNEKAYEPQLISIGPYHRGKLHLKAMEERKIGFLQQLVEETMVMNASKYVMKMRELETQARKCYEQPLCLDSDEFVKMLLLDGCFIVQLIRLCLKKDLVNYYTNGYFLALIQDFLLVENQLPFFVIWELFSVIETGVDQGMFIEAVFDMFFHRVPGKGRPKHDLISITSEIKHLLDFTYHHCCHPSSSELEALNETRNFDMNFIRCALELQESGIKFETIEGNSMFDIRFENKTLLIPKLNIDDYTESFLRNLIAFEQLFVADRDVKHASDYMVLMDSLIDSPKDVEILCQHGIINNMLGDDKAVAAMINSLGIYVCHSHNFYYSGVFEDVNKHCSKRWNIWMANLKHNYFNSPWSLISLMAAILLLLLTVLQTVLSVLSYYQ